VPGGMAGGVGALLGFGAKKTKYVLHLLLSGPMLVLTFALSSGLDHRRPAGSAGGRHVPQEEQGVVFLSLPSSSSWSCRVV
jgi:hypothetical protein